MPSSRQLIGRVGGDESLEGVEFLPGPAADVVRLTVAAQPVSATLPVRRLPQTARRREPVQLRSGFVRVAQTSTLSHAQRRQRAVAHEEMRPVGKASLTFPAIFPACNHTRVSHTFTYCTATVNWMTLPQTPVSYSGSRYLIQLFRSSRLQLYFGMFAICAPSGRIYRCVFL